MNRIVPILVVALAVVAGAGYWISQKDAPAQTKVEPVHSASTETAPAEAAPEGNAEAPAVTEMVLGAADAPITLYEYASFTCGHCATFHEEVLKPLKVDYVETGKVRFIFREVYFDRVGLWASMVARCGGEERFFGLTDLIMKGQREWARSGDPVAITQELKKIGRLAGLEDETLTACMTDQAKAEALVAWADANTAEHKINATPTMIINGEQHSNMSYANLKEILDGLLAQ